MDRQIVSQDLLGGRARGLKVGPMLGGLHGWGVTVSGQVRDKQAHPCIIGNRVHRPCAILILALAHT